MSLSLCDAIRLRPLPDDAETAHHPPAARDVLALAALRAEPVTPAVVAVPAYSTVRCAA